MSPALIRSFVALAACVLVAASPAVADNFPDDFFFPDRPQALKDIEGKPAPELSLEQWIGDETSLQAAQGKVVVVDFWATWCGPCMASIPHNVELVKKFRDKGLVFIGVHDAASGWDKAAGVVADKGINYSVARDKSGGVSAKAFGLGFWPTYVAIDHRGVVRTAGLRPDRVDAVVEALIAEMPAIASGSGGNPTEWYLGGGQRPGWLRQAEGKKDVKLESAEWLGKALSDDDRKGRVVVLHFVSPTSEIGMRQLLELAKLETELGPQGMSVVGVCDARAEWNSAKMLFEQRGVKVPVVHDLSASGAKPAAAPAAPDAAPAEPAEAPKPAVPTVEEPIDPKLSPLGKTANALGIRLAPTTIVIDRNGVVRTAGVKPDKVKEIVNKLLAEQAAPSA